LKQKILILLFVLPVLNVFGQRVQTILQGSHTDSSFYHVARISDNEFWAGGEHGILKSIDTLGNFKSIPFPHSGLDILKILRVDDYIYIITSNSIICRYDFAAKSFITKQFPKFNGKCFYDLISLPDGRLMVCGGHNGIAQGDIRFPRGFIALLDKDLNEIDVVWKSFRKFVWSLLQVQKDEILAVSFNGFRSRIMKSNNFEQWKKETKVKGLIHEIAQFDDSIWYSGSKNIRYKSIGIWGKKDQRNSPSSTDHTGCLWSMEQFKENVLLASYSGNLITVDTKTSKAELLSIAQGYSLYDMEIISNSKVLVVGHGKGLYFINFD